MGRVKARAGGGGGRLGRGRKRTRLGDEIAENSIKLKGRGGGGSGGRGGGSALCQIYYCYAGSSEADVFIGETGYGRVGF